MNDWTLAFKVFIFGFSGVFVTLAVLMLAISISGFINKKLTKQKEGK